MYKIYYCNSISNYGTEGVTKENLRIGVTKKCVGKCTRMLRCFHDTHFI
jgi:hypothetical protein